MDYQELFQHIEAATRPEQGNEEDLLGVLLYGGPVGTGLVLLRSALANIESVVDRPDDDPHGEVFAKELKRNTAKLHKTINLLLRDYARAVDELQDCQCLSCQQVMAEFN